MRPFLMAFAACLFGLPATLGHAAPVHGIAMHGDPALPPDYKHFGYVNPDVKKGGRIAYGDPESGIAAAYACNSLIWDGLTVDPRWAWNNALRDIVLNESE